VRNRKIIGILTIILLVCLCAGKTYVFAAEKGIGMVLEKKGDVKLNGKKALMMQPIFQNSQVVTGSKGSLVFVSYIDNKEYLVGPGSEISIGAKSFSTKKGSIKRISGGEKIPLPKNTVLISRKILGEMYREDEKFLRIIHPGPSMLLTSDTVKFKWSGTTDKYKIDIIERASGKHLKGFPKSKMSRKSPIEFETQLEYGKSYSIMVQEKEDEFDEDGNKVEVIFHILPEGKALKIQAVEKKYAEIKAKGRLEARKGALLMIDYYKENGMYHQALKLLRELESSEKDNPYIYFYMAEMYDKLGNKNEAAKMMERGNKLKK